MLTLFSIFKRTAVLLAILSALTAHGQGTLIGLGVRNGGFEAGIASPWGGIAVAQDPAFADQGSWYCVAQKTLLLPDIPVLRTLAFQHLPANPANGNDFLVTFAARVGTNGFDSVVTDFSAQNTGGVFVFAAKTPVLTPTLVSSEWRIYQTQFSLPPHWDGGGNISLTIEFLKNGAVVGNPYVGFLDNVTLQQVPEPAAFSLLALGGLSLTVFRRRRRENGVEYHGKRGPCG